MGKSNDWSHAVTGGIRDVFVYVWILDFCLHLINFYNFIFIFIVEWMDGWLAGGLTGWMNR